ncbi:MULTISPECIES: sensor histidine kinase [Emticicia]|uniref:sensor histidine kinase n=1 Tax=Emticicia TaxID=312278 RepID=UPI000C77AD88|nr:MULTISPECIES: sensor histidine kinase [Emticicia]PLK45421.1 histidine kinase [Emticicia sp. TH156]UTA69625.1 CHASE3 domain-containing protein [Emticicia sp. 21SJ11W-3]
MRKPFRYVTISFISCIILLMILTVVSYLKVHQTLAYMEDIERNYQVMMKGEELISKMKDMETGQRGYLLTQRNVFLNPYYDAYRVIGKIINELEDLVEHNEGQTQRLMQLKKLIAEKIQITETNIKLARIKTAVSAESLKSDKLKMDEIRNVMNLFLLTEKQILNNKYALKISNDKHLPGYIISLSASSALLLLASFGFLIYELRKRIRFQKALENNLDKLQRTNSELEQFAYVASHDLKEPLRKIRAFSGILLKKHYSSLNQDGQESLNKIEKSAERMQLLIDDLLTFSRTVNHYDQELQTVDLNQMLEEVETDLSLAIEEKKVRIITEELPVIKAFPFQIKQLFYNLINNSIKFSQNDIAPIIEISSEEMSGKDIFFIEGLREESTFYHLCFQDNGIGFEPGYAEKIFVIFQRLHGRHEYEGTGIGLAICKRVMGNHNGFIFAEGQVNKGARFHLFFPKTFNPAKGNQFEKLLSV